MRAGAALALLSLLLAAARGQDLEDRCRIGTYRNLQDSSAWLAGCPGFSLVEPGFYAQRSRRMPCANGTYSPVAGAVSCAPCEEGFYCEQAFDSTLNVLRGSTSPRQHPCEWPANVCPAGSGVPIRVLTGNFATGLGTQGECLPGSYCVAGERRPCPAGRYGATAGLATPACSGPCRRGHYCPEGSVSATQAVCGDPSVFCPEGSGRPLEVQQGPDSGGRAQFTLGRASADGDAAIGAPRIDALITQQAVIEVEDSGSLTAPVRSDSALCPAGFYCPPSTGLRVPCPAGRFSEATGASSADVCQPCRAGSLCSEASPSATQMPCGGPDVFCPAGSSTPTRAGTGNWTTGGDGPDRRASRAPCPVGHYCPGDGIARPCPPGTYASERGQSRCRKCAAGYVCRAAGSTSPIASPCGSAGVVCPPGSSEPLPCTAGFYTLRVEPAADPALVDASMYANADALRLALARAKAAADLTLATAASPEVVARTRQLATDANDWEAHLLRETVGRWSDEPEQAHAPQQRALPHMWLRALSQDTLLPAATATVGFLVLPLASQASLSSLSSSLHPRSLIGASATLSGRLDPSGVQVIEPLVASGSTGNDPIDGEYRAATTVEIATGEPARALWASVADDTAAIRTHERQCDEGHYCEGDGVRRACPAGTFARRRGLVSADECSVCPAGWFCPEPGTVEPVPCGGADRFCPVGTVSPRFVSLGFWTEGGPANSSAHRIAEQPCPLGFYCSGGERVACPAGRFGAKEREDRPLCSGACEAGFFCPPGSESGRAQMCGGPGQYCPLASAEPVAVPAGFYSVGGRTASSGGLIRPEAPERCDRSIPVEFDDDDGASATVTASQLIVAVPLLREPLQVAVHDPRRACVGGQLGDGATRSAVQPCEPGHYCRGGLKFECPPGRFGSSYRAIEPSCSGPCMAGFFCPWASQREDQHECGSSDRFCPRASSRPIGVSLGSQTDPSEPVARRTRQLDCPLGWWCGPDGVARKCPAGRYGARRNESSALCSGACAPGFLCPEASVSAAAVECGGSHVYCPVGSSVPRVVPPGFYSTGESPAQNPAPLDQALLTAGITPRAGGAEPAVAVVTAASAARPPPLASLAVSASASNRTRSAIAPCPVGHYCEGGVLRQCPAGTLGNATRLSSSRCVEPCPAGSFCPPGSIGALRCGDVFVNTTLRDAYPDLLANISDIYEAYASVAAGAYATGAGSLSGPETRQRLAAAASNGDAAGVIQWESGGRLQQAAFAGDVRSRASEHALPLRVGPTSVFCPEGSGWPVGVAGGHFTTGHGANATAEDRAGNMTRTGQAPCPPGSFCVAGEQRPCPPGTFGSTARLASRLCSGTCPAGHECPLGTSQPRECPDATYAPPGSSRCIPCPGAAGSGSAQPRRSPVGLVPRSGLAGPRHPCKTERSCCNSL